MRNTWSSRLAQSTTSESDDVFPCCESQVTNPPRGRLRMKTSFRFVFVILCCVFVHYDAAKVEAQYLHPKLVEKKVTIRSAVILPAKVEIVKESAKGQEMMVAESADIS